MAAPARLAVRSPAFEDGGEIPRRFTCDGKDVSPAVSWAGVPPETRTIAVLHDDPDAPNGTWVHWIFWDLPASVTELAEGAHEGKLGATQGRNSWGRTGYGGPCPPSGTHRYFWKVYALDDTLGLPAGSDAAALVAAMRGHVVAEGVIMGTYRRA